MAATVAATAPHNIKICSKCKKSVNKYSDKLINFMKNNLEHIEFIKLFLFDYNNNHNLVLGKCENCLWEQINKKKPKPNQRVPVVFQRIYSKYIANNETNICLCILAIISAMLLSTCIYGWIYGNDINDSEVNIDKLKSTIKGVQEQFPSLQPSLLKKMDSGFFRLKSPGEPFVLMLLHDNTNKQTTDCLASYTSFAAKQNIFTNTMESLWLNGSEWSQYSDNVDNKNLLYDKLLTPLTKNKVLVLENLQDLPWSLASKFHHLCDTENPHIANAMYIIELRVDEDNLQQLTESQKLIVAERTMTAAWEDAPYSFRAALISRLTSFVDITMITLNNECPKTQMSFINISP